MFYWGLSSEKVDLLEMERKQMFGMHFTAHIYGRNMGFGLHLRELFSSRSMFMRSDLIYIDGGAIR